MIVNIRLIAGIGVVLKGQEEVVERLLEVEGEVEGHALLVENEGVVLAVLEALCQVVDGFLVAFLGQVEHAPLQQELVILGAYLDGLVQELRSDRDLTCSAFLKSPSSL